MRTQKRIDALLASSRFLVFAPALILLVAADASAGSNAVRAGDESRISVTAVAGDVDVTMAGSAVAVSINTTVLLPARVVTGRDGTLGIAQAGTSVSVASDSDVEIPAEAVDGNLVARLVQHRGNVFYDVAPRDVGKLRVETPLLVAVIKGTQFNVAVQEDSTTISLFEGRLEIRTPDGSDVVQLNAGEIAIRSRADESIRVVGMNDARIAAPGDARLAAADVRTAPGDAVIERRALLSDGVAGAIGAASATAESASGALKPILDTAGFELGGAAAGILAVGTGLTANLDAAVAAPAVDVGLDAGVDLGSAAVDVGLDAGVDLGSVAVDIGLDAGVDLGGAAVDARLDAGVDLGAGTVDVGLDAGVDLGGAAVDAGLDAGVDLGAGTVDLGLDAEIDLGGALADTSVAADVTLDAGAGDVGVDAGLDVGGVLDVGLDVDLGSGTVDLDLGLGGATPEDAAPPPAPSGGLGGLLGGLL